MHAVSPAVSRSLFALLLPLAAAAALAAEPLRVAGEWTRHAPVPERRTEVGVATDGERIYLIGGFAPDEQRGAAGDAGL